MSVMAVSILLILASLPFIVFRLIRGPEWTDRLIACDLLSLALAAAILILMHESGWGWDRDTVWVIVIASFLSTLGVTWIIAAIQKETGHER